MASLTCTHIKVTGIRCGSPALRGEPFCYFHQRVHRGVRTPPQSRLHPIALIEDEESIQSALMEVINSLMRNTIDLKRAGLILRALHIAVKNAARVKFNTQASSMVKEVPEYEEPLIDIAAAPPSELDPPFAAALAPETRTARSNWGHPAPRPPEESKADMIAHYYGYANAQAHAAAQKAKADSAAKAAADKAAAEKPAPEKTQSAPSHVGTDAVASHPTKRKPSASAPAPKERKTAAHHASGE